MFIIIDNSEEGVVRVSGIQNRNVSHLSFPRKRESSNRRMSIIKAFDKFLKKRKLPLKNIKGIGIVSGANSFTSSRLSATFGNTMAYALKIPIISLEPGWTPAQALARFRKAKPGKYIAPKYSGEARVTVS
jgi:tRNA A37 threonylcarbamoyladenosine modification protein TsaB